VTKRTVRRDAGVQQNSTAAFSGADVDVDVSTEPSESKALTVSDLSSPYGATGPREPIRWRIRAGLEREFVGMYEHWYCIEDYYRGMEGLDCRDAGYDPWTFLMQHRGDCRDRAENGVRSIEEAIEAGDSGFGFSEEALRAADLDQSLFLCWDALHFVSKAAEENSAVIVITCAMGEAFLTELSTAIGRLPEKCRSAVVCIETNGGDSAAAHRAASLLQQRFDKLYVVVSHHCYSAGTIIALAGDQLWMTPTAVLGPVDSVNGSSFKEFKETSAGFAEIVAIRSRMKLDDKASQAVDKFLFGFLKESNVTVQELGAKTLTSKFAVGFVRDVLKRTLPSDSKEEDRHMIAQYFFEARSRHASPFTGVDCQRILTNKRVRLFPHLAVPNGSGSLVPIRPSIHDRIKNCCSDGRGSVVVFFRDSDVFARPEILRETGLARAVIASAATFREVPPLQQEVDVVTHGVPCVWTSAEYGEDLVAMDILAEGGQAWTSFPERDGQQNLTDAFELEDIFFR
jgi:hypothetical protein